jgi:hypothetical protein
MLQYGAYGLVELRTQDGSILLCGDLSESIQTAFRDQ